MADPIRIGAPDGTVIEFPSGTGDDVIKRVMAQNFPAQAPSPQAPATAAPAHHDKGWLESADDLVRAVANGMTFGLADRFAAAASSATGIGGQPMGLKDLVTGAGNDYASNLERERRRTDAFREEHPYIAPGLNMVGSMAVPMGAIGAAAKGGSLGIKTLRAYAAGGGIGTIAGALESRDWTDPGQVARDAVVGGLGGATIGAVIPGASRVIGKGVEAVTNAVRGRADGMSRSATNHLVDAMRADTPAAAQAELRRLGPDAMMADAGPAFLGKTQGASLNSDEGRNVIFNALEARDKGTNQRIMSDVEHALGPAEDPQTVTNNIINTRSRLDEANYGHAFQNNPQVRTAPLMINIEDAILSSPERSAERRALENLQQMLTRDQRVPRLGADGRQMHDTNNQPLFDTIRVNQGSAEVLHKVKQELDNVIEHELPGLGVQAGALRNKEGALKRFRFELNQAIEDQVPGYAHANEVSARLAQRAEAVKAGTQYLGEGKTTPSPARFQDEFEQRELGERIALGKGSRGDIERQLGTKANDLVALKQALQGEGGWNTAKIGIVHGDDAANELMASVDRNLKFRDTHNKVSQNSQTEIRRAAREQMKPGAESKDLPIVNPSSTITGALATLAKRYIAEPAWSALTHVDPTRSYGEIGRIVTAQGAERDRHFQAILDAMNRRDGNAAVASKLGDRGTLAAAIVANALLDDQKKKRIYVSPYRGD
ncbi:hypothetical protein JJC00_18830 [Bradyrhizobium diazoefficiens]|uniref:hypothetical protein n=1 Tax=Bradyrhizobium diazoefficiens TaxID=1355477 RepID=UPI00190BB190|nr:hypothetical protein [Bradyrhizobium diazoefficiens]QQO30740.1 hypothetical protein JJC00_18830 [Bradyrhizobium diazoefficiens]